MTDRPCPRVTTTWWQAALAVAAGLLLGLANASADPAQWQSHRLDAATVAVPADWTANRTNGGKDLELASPDGQRRLMVWWWFPDEPLLGYPDIVSHRKVTLAGRSALYIHTRSGGRDTITVTLDKGRQDKRRLHLLFEGAGDLGQGDAVLDDILSRVTLDGAPSADPRRSEAAPPSSPAPAPSAAAAPAAPAGRVWLGRVSIAPPPGWSATVDRDAVRLTRPDGVGRIELSLLADGQPMPSEGVEDVDHTVTAGQPATRLMVRNADSQAVVYIFDEPDADGARASLTLTAAGASAGDVATFETVAESLSTAAPTAEPGAAEPGAAPAAPDDPDQDPFAGLDLD
ncbi:hypothetical protein [Blastochloris viridis]|uniref:Uncharacterized protein n=1 Tax=Blastochloris viridis TaxID=1079 RepID=A0A0H5BIA1_BLAVI|nr:hypothetical protein [Blastochloris viridis]ALK09949.1 hypothetical protein BVIR_2181 [Blastochloris viridis]BAS00142.1 hypothetical protein BV133_2548 [Blastochloris viridis]CUU42612.1 hypothetical protein BVIRIDIS_16260 [Blastochloris viridis]